MTVLDRLLTGLNPLETFLVVAGVSGALWGLVAIVDAMIYEVEDVVARGQTTGRPQSSRTASKRGAL
jgi:hypothetical protein